jgi:hypothetical protein
MYILYWVGAHPQRYCTLCSVHLVSWKLFVLAWTMAVDIFSLVAYWYSRIDSERYPVFQLFSVFGSYETRAIQVIYSRR